MLPTLDVDWQLAKGVYWRGLSRVVLTKVLLLFIEIRIKCLNMYCDTCLHDTTGFEFRLCSLHWPPLFYSRMQWLLRQRPKRYLGRTGSWNYSVWRLGGMWRPWALERRMMPLKVFNSTTVYLIKKMRMLRADILLLIVCRLLVTVVICWVVLFNESTLLAGTACHLLCSWGVTFFDLKKTTTKKGYLYGLLSWLKMKCLFVSVHTCHHKIRAFH